MADEPLNPVEIRFSASLKGLIDGLSNATSHVKTATAEMQNTFGGLGKTIENLKAPFIAFTALLAGGAVFKSLVTETNNWNSEAIKLARTLGITTEQASILNLALGDVYTDTETYIRGVQMMTRQLNTGGEAFAKLGISTRDANGHLKPSTELMTEVIEKLNSLKAGTDRNAAGLSLFGRAWGELQPLLKLNAEAMAEAKKKAEQLHLIVGPEGVAQTLAYKAAMNDVEDIFLSLKVQVGNALLPILVQLGKWFGESGPVLAEAMSVSIKVLIEVFMFLKAVIESLVQSFMGWFQIGLAVVTGFGKALWAVAHGDFAGAKDAIKSGAEDVKIAWQVAVEGIDQAWANFAKKHKELWAPPPKPTATKVTGGVDSFDPGKVTDKSGEMVQSWKEALDTMKLDQEKFGELTLADEYAFWRERLALTTKGSAARRAVVAEMVRVDEEISKKSAGEGLKDASAMEKAEQRKIELARLAIDAKRDAQLASIDLDEQEITLRAQLGEITGRQEIEQLKSTEAEKYQIRLQAAKDALALDNQYKDPVKYQQDLLKIEELERAHTARMAELNGRAAQLSMQRWQSFIGTLQGALSSAISGMIQGTQTLAQGIRNIFGSVLDFFIQMVSQMLARWVAGKIAEKLITKTTGASSISAGAGTAAVNAMASVAAIPVIGWAMAPGVFASTLALGLSALTTLATAAGGYDIPGSLNPLVQAHAREMILPAKYADVIRGMADGGGAQQPAPRPVNVNITAFDSRDVYRALRDNKSPLARVLGEMHRNGRTS